MKDFPLPVRMVGAGSQPVEDEELQYLDMPRDMNTFRMPLVPERADPLALREARDLLAAYRAALEQWAFDAQAAGPVLDLLGTPPPVLTIVNEMLGEGEVSIRIDGDRSVRIQESVFTGVWRVCEIDGAGALVADRLETGALPPRAPRRRPRRRS